MHANIAVGFLVHRPSRRVLLHLRGPENDPDPNLWAAIGGHEEPEDNGDLRQTLRRELDEELEYTISIADVREVWREIDGMGRAIAVHVVSVAAPDDRFLVSEGREVRWFAIAAALALPNLADVTRADLPRIAEWLDTTDT